MDINDNGNVFYKCPQCRMCSFKKQFKNMESKQEIANTKFSSLCTTNALCIFKTNQLYDKFIDEY